MTATSRAFSAPQHAGIVPFVPMKVIEARGKLSDGFTPSMRVEIGGETFFLLVNETGSLLRAGEPGVVRWERGVTMAGDTLEVLRANALRLRDPLKRSSTLLGAGERMRREFRSGAETYVRMLDDANRFGWVTLDQKDQGRLWLHLTARSSSSSDPLGSTEARVGELLDQTNGLLDSLFSFMNARLRTSRTAPRWELRRADGGLSCELRGLSDPAAMGESTKALARRIELAVAGAGYAVSYTPGSIRIRP